VRRRPARGTAALLALVSLVARLGIRLVVLVVNSVVADGRIDPGEAAIGGALAQFIRRNGLLPAPESAPAM
jgi:hypothetical protein